MRMSGCLRTCGSPMKASRRNHVSMIGPKTLPIFAVPLRCAMKSTVRITKATGTTKRSMLGKATSRPSTAESTEIAGVMTESPKNRAAPKTPRSATSTEIRPGVRLRRTRVARARMPPSPSLSARSTKHTYLMVTMRTSTQTMQEMTPVMSSRLSGTALPSSMKTVRSTYKGLVPMSPKTTPRAESPSAIDPVCFAVPCPRREDSESMRDILRPPGPPSSWEGFL